ncbi:Adaptin ear-binding coat-associated protein 2 (NECAP-2) isoform 2 family protein [Besnoitia besnoiti]|uniref:Adaptin ear-binding coat-associated protein 2 (NECAP-2) isoform 2 family protein n=1 Tax=Besnoitia besnoiti TaxID=94643 RepID=A0A2A9MNE7_BESBE|nr:Adaptin ear-binding coat-associated protein 2 (NECAP-2) isoform 2 family protein [Besnoitia besnoiti]PFH37736.1 Adaptin ear-binding coat-associated protein 2 (NECAP-2) isoform 2 family protein [Besnoitia besnoiti]
MATPASQAAEAVSAKPSPLDQKDDEALELVIYSCREVTVYKIPPRSLQGHRAENWTAAMWKGRLQIITKGGECAIRLVDPSTGDLFAACPLPEKHDEAVERTVDSSRYFVLRLDNGEGRRAYVGVGFEERNEAFDFTCALNDEERRRHALSADLPELASNAAGASAPAARDYRLHEGEKIRVQIRGMTCKTRVRPAETENVTSAADGVAESPSPFFPGLLPPPPDSKRAETEHPRERISQTAETADDSFAFEFTEFQRAAD